MRKQTPGGLPWAPRSEMDFTVGVRVALSGLVAESDRALNGITGLIESWDPDTSRWSIALAGRLDRVKVRATELCR